MKRIPINIKFIIIVIACFWVGTILLPNNLVIPISAGVGITILLLGIMQIYKFINFANDLQIKIIPKAVISFLVGCISLALWYPLFTFKYWFFWKFTNYGNIMLWAINTSVFCFLLFLETKIKIISSGYKTDDIIEHTKHQQIKNTSE